MIQPISHREISQRASWTIRSDSPDHLRPNPIVVVLVCLVIAFNFTIGLYWVAHAGDIPARAELGDAVALLFKSYAVADPAFYNHVTQQELALGWINVTAGQVLTLWLLASLLLYRPEGPSLQLAVGSCVSYSVFIHWWCAGIAGFSNIADKSSASIFLFFAAAAPWLLAHLYIAWDAWRRIVGRIRGMSTLWSDVLVSSSAAMRDRWIIAALIFFIIVAYAVELPWFILSAELPQRTDILGQMWATYGRADRGYYDLVTPFERGLESFHVFFTQCLYLLLIGSILWRWSYRYPLQLAVGAYVCYSTALYLVAKHVTGYALMPEHNLAGYLILYGANLPWLVGNFLIALHAAAIIRRMFLVTTPHFEKAHAACHSR
jgi:hypothetical protein